MDFRVPFGADTKYPRKDFTANSILEVVGKAYYDFRADLMVRNNEGLTNTYIDEVLGRLLELNRQRGEQDRLSGAAAERKSKKPRKTTRNARDEGQPRLFGDGSAEFP
jgi:hypothetical protein